MSSISNLNDTHKKKVRTNINTPISKNRISAASGYFEHDYFKGYLSNKQKINGFFFYASLVVFYLNTGKRLFVELLF